MSRFSVELSELDLVIERMATVESQLTEVYDDVAARMRRVHVSWTGRAAEEHRAAYLHWANGATETNEALARLRTIARTAHENYAGAIVANRTMWAS